TLGACASPTGLLSSTAGLLALRGIRQLACDSLHRATSVEDQLNAEPDAPCRDVLLLDCRLDLRAELGDGLRHAHPTVQLLYAPVDRDDQLTAGRLCSDG